MNCFACNARLVEDANFCHRCGANVCEREDDIPPNLRSVTKMEAEADVTQVASGGGFVSRHGATESISGEGTGAPEREIWAGRYSPKAMATSFVGGMLLTFVSLVGAIVGAVRDVQWLWITLLVAVPILWVGQLLQLMKRWLNAHYRLTDRRLLRQLGVFQRHKDQLDLTRVESVRILQNVLHRFLDVGSIEILSSDRRLRRVVLEGIDNADELAETIRSLVSSKQPPLVKAAG